MFCSYLAVFDAQMVMVAVLEGGEGRRRKGVWFGCTEVGLGIPMFVHL